MELDRRRFCGVSAAGLASQADEAVHAQGAARKPNVLVLISDQHRPDLMSCAGHALVPTPNLDRIAAGGVRFSRAYCPYPVCAPSRMALMTGLYAHTHGVIDNDTMLDWRRQTVARTFRENGYLTALIGKMHFLDGNSHGFEYRLGFDDWLMYLGPKGQLYANEIAAGPGYAERVYDTGCGFPDVVGLWRGPSPWAGHVQPAMNVASELPAENHFDAFVAREAANFIRRYRDQPFFLVAGFLKPHGPFNPPKEYAERYPVEKVELPAQGDLSKYPRYIRAAAERYRRLGEDQLRRFRAGYLGSLAFLDVCIGEVYKALEECGLAQDTIVVYTSDHGEMGGEHGLFQKFMFFEPSVGVPLIVRYPKVAPAGKVSGALVEYAGLYPVLAELAGLAAPRGTEAPAFTPWVREPDRPGLHAVHSEYALSTQPRFMIRTDRYKYVYNETDIPELYDLEADPGEFANLADDAAMRNSRQRLHEELLAWYDPARNPYRRTQNRKQAAI